jgi:hypothetical protein
MKTFKQIVNEVAEPLGGDEQNFKDKHEIEVWDHPVALEGQFKGTIDQSFNVRLADYSDGEDEEVYESCDVGDAVVLKSDGKKGRVVELSDDGVSADVELFRDGEVITVEVDDLKQISESELTPAQEKKKEEIVLAMKKDEEGLKKKYGPAWKNIMYATATKKAKETVTEAKKVTIGKNDAIIGQFKGSRGAKLLAKKKGKYYDVYVYNEYDGSANVIVRGLGADGIAKALDAPHIKSTIAKAGGVDLDTAVIGKLKESADNLIESIKQGRTTLKDGSTVQISSQDASLLNKMLGELTPQNRKKMQDVMMLDKSGFEEIVGFAREAM